MHFDKTPIKYRYVAEKYEGNYIFRPKVEVRLSNKGNIFRLVMLVDSGADVCFIPLEIAEILEIKLTDSKKPARSASGQFKTKFGYVDAELLKSGEAISLGNIPIMVPAEHLNDNDYMLNYALLGRKPFFHKFDVLFRDKSKKIVLTPRQILKRNPF